MATVTRKTGKKGDISFLFQVRKAGFKAAAKTIRVTTTERAALAEGNNWAEGLERDLRHQKSRGATRPDITQLTIARLINEYLEDPETKALRSYDGMERSCAWWANKYGTTRVLDFGVATVREARNKLHTAARGSATVNRAMSAMRSAWNWARASGLIPTERGWPPRTMLREPRGRTRFLSDDEMHAVLEASRKAGPVVYACIAVSLSSGLRRGELLRLEWKDVDLDRGQATILRTKNDQPRAVHLTATAVDALKALRKLGVVSAIHPFLVAGGRQLNTNALEWHWRQVRKAAKLHDFKWHDLRHTCASVLAQNGASLLEIGSVLGHKSPQMTLRYAHLIAGKSVAGHAALDAKMRGK